MPTLTGQIAPRNRERERGEEMKDITAEEKLAVIANRIAQWNQSLYGHTVDMRIFEQAGFKELKANATTSAQRAQIVIDELEKEMEAVRED